MQKANMSALTDNLIKLSGWLILANLASQCLAAAEKAAEFPTTAPATSAFKTSETCSGVGQLVDIDFERATTPEIVKFFALHETNGRIPLYGPRGVYMQPEYALALVLRANTHPKTKVFRVLKDQGLMTQGDLFTLTIFDPITRATSHPLAAAINAKVERRIFANFIAVDRRCCAFKCCTKSHVKKQPRFNISN